MGNIGREAVTSDVTQTGNIAVVACEITIRLPVHSQKTMFLLQKIILFLSANVQRELTILNH